MNSLKTAVLLIVFNRPDKARKIFEAIKTARPEKLYIAADGPRTLDEQSQCDECRALVDEVDWDCQVKTLFREKNIGCGKGPYEAINWLFQHEEAGIILEDDCLPHSTFFPFCQEILERYWNDTRVMHVAGSYFLGDWQRDSDYSYHFSQHGATWGWATWKRAWQYYDYRLSLLPEVEQKNYFDHFFYSEKEKKFRLKWFRKTYEATEKIDWWDYQWDFARYVQRGLSVVPNTNLITNIGFGNDATHTFNTDLSEANMAVRAMDFPLHHPPFVIRDYKTDKRKMDAFLSRPLSLRIKNRLKRIFTTYE